MKTKKLVLVALLVALSFVGSNLKIFGTIAFDSLPAFLGALLLGPAYGAIIGFLGHIFSALLSGFPYGLVIHGVIAASMAITMFGFGFTYKKLQNRVAPAVNLVIAGVVGTILNGPVSLAISYPLLVPMMGQAGVFAMLPVLTITSAANIVFALVLFKALEKVWGKLL